MKEAIDKTIKSYRSVSEHPSMILHFVVPDDKECQPNRIKAAGLRKYHYFSLRLLVEFNGDVLTNNVYGGSFDFSDYFDIDAKYHATFPAGASVSIICDAVSIAPVFIDVEIDFTLLPMTDEQWELSDGTYQYKI